MQYTLYNHSQCNELRGPGISEFLAEGKKVLECFDLHHADLGDLLWCALAEADKCLCTVSTLEDLERGGLSRAEFIALRFRARELFQDDEARFFENVAWGKLLDVFDELCSIQRAEEKKLIASALKRAVELYRDGDGYSLQSAKSDIQFLDGVAVVFLEKAAMIEGIDSPRKIFYQGYLAAQAILLSFTLAAKEGYSPDIALDYLNRHFLGRFELKFPVQNVVASQQAEFEEAVKSLLFNNT